MSAVEAGYRVRVIRPPLASRFYEYTPRSHRDGKCGTVLRLGGSWMKPDVLTVQLDDGTYPIMLMPDEVELLEDVQP